MAFALKLTDKTAASALRRIAREQLGASLSRLNAPVEDQAELVHELRKNAKKTRALLRLVRPNLKAYDTENAALRDAAHIVAALRDTDVLGATFDQVAVRAGISGTSVAKLRLAVVPAQHAGPDAAKLLSAHGAAIKAIDIRIKGWVLRSKGFGALIDGLERTWKAAQRTMAQAEAAPTGDALHQWRKRVKDHWYHARLLKPIWPEMMAIHIAAADTLGKTLGEARDLAFLLDALDGTSGAGALRTQAQKDKAALLTNAFALGTRYFSEPSQGLSERWHCWWKLWQLGGVSPPRPFQSASPSHRPRKGQ